MVSASQKKTGSSPRGSASGRSARSSGNRSGRGGTVQERKPVRREVGGLLCLLLAVFATLGCFHIDALFIRFFCGLTKGLIGCGYWLLPPALLWAALILGFHRGRPVKLRVWCVLLLPVAAGCFVHLFLAGKVLPWDSSLVKTLWESGKTLRSGGLAAGVVTQGLIVIFSKIGAGLILVLLMLGLLMGALRLTPSDIVDWLRERPHPEYEIPPESYPDQEKRGKAEGGRPAASRRLRPAIDIPVDDEPPVREEEPRVEETREPARKRGFFNSKPKVPSPDQLLTLQSANAEVPEQTAEKETLSPAVSPDPFRLPKEEGLERSEQFNQPTVPVTIPPVASFAEPKAEGAAPAMPEIVREPAVSKLKKGDAEEAAAQVTAEVEEALQQTASVYDYPTLDLLKEGGDTDAGGVQNELRANQIRLTDTIHSFGIDADIVSVTRGPSVARYELELEQGVRLNKLTNLADDIALALGASGVRIAPIPNQISMVGIEVPNKLVTPVPIREVVGSDNFQNAPSKVSFAVGKDIGGNCIVGNIAKLPHLLIAGTTGSGKSVCTNSLIISLLYKASPEEVRLIMVDPKMVELGIYNGIPHLLIPVVTDPKKAAGALQWAVVEMMKRYRAFSEIGVRDLASYNAHAEKTEDMSKMPQIVVVIDELADLMLVAAKEVEESICRVAQMGRAAGMHLIIATQRPSADVITGLMKANIPSRIAFAVASSLESRIILDQTGAEKLVGRGDMLYFPLGSGKPTRVQGCLISDEEVAAVVEHVKRSGTARYDDEVLHQIEQSVVEKEKGSKGGGAVSPEETEESFDELLPAAIEVVVETGMASVSMLQRRLKLGYSRAARLVDQMEEKGVVGPFEGSKPRQVLVSKEQWQEMQYKQGMAVPAPDAPPVSEPVPEELEFERDAVAQGTEAPPFAVGEDDF